MTWGPENMPEEPRTPVRIWGGEWDAEWRVGSWGSSIRTMPRTEPACRNRTDSWVKGNEDELRRNVVVVPLAGETQREKAGKVREGWCVQRGSSRTPEASVGRMQGLRFRARRALNVPQEGTGAPPGVTRSHWDWWREREHRGGPRSDVTGTMVTDIKGLAARMMESGRICDSMNCYLLFKESVWEISHENMKLDIQERKEDCR